MLGREREECEREGEGARSEPGFQLLGGRDGMRI